MVLLTGLVVGRMFLRLPQTITEVLRFLWQSVATEVSSAAMITQGSTLVI